MSEIATWSAVETAKNIASGDVSVAEVARAHLAQLEARNPTINAVIDRCDDVVEQAEAMDKAGPDPARPLYGVPITVKCNVDQKGYATTNGLPALKDNVAAEDSAVVANLKTAGALILGRTNTPEFSMRWCTSNPLHGVSLNPWDTRATPGGSSGAAAAAVASGIGTIAHGNDLGGSLRYPAFCCGVATIRPSAGRIPSFNPSLPNRPALTMSMSVQGPIARNVADVRLGLGAMAARSANDPAWTAAADSGRLRGKGLRVGYSSAPFAVTVEDAAIKQAMDTSVNALREIGATCVERPFEGADAAAQLWGDLLFTEVERTSRAVMAEMGSGELNRLIEDYSRAYRLLDLDGLLAAMTKRLELQRAAAQMVDDVDLYLMPTSLIRPFANDLDFRAPEKVPMILDAQKPLHLVNVLGLPSVAIPTGVVEGLPVGVQLIAPMHDDAFALDVAERIEGVIGTIWQHLPFDQAGS